MSDLIFKIGANLQGYSDALLDGSAKLGKFVDDAAKQFGILPSGPMALVAAVGAIGAAAVHTAIEYEEAFNRIHVATGATGPALEGLKEDFRAVFLNVPQDADTVSSAIGELNTRLGLTGQPLQELTKQFLDLADVTGGDVQSTIRNATRLFGDWSVATEEQGRTLDLLFTIGQRTGISVDRLAGSLVQFGAPLRQMGFDLQTSAALLGKFEAEGVNAELVMGSLRIALTRMAQAGVTDAGAALTALTENIKNAGSAGEANALAVQLFGAKAGPDMAAAIREGRFEVGNLIGSLGNFEGAIARADDATETLGERAGILWKKLMDLIEPIGRLGIALGESLVGSLESAMRGVDGWVQAWAKLTAGDFAGVWDTLKNGADEYRGAQERATTATTNAAAAKVEHGKAAEQLTAKEAALKSELDKALATLGRTKAEQRAAATAAKEHERELELLEKRTANFKRKAEELLGLHKETVPNLEKLSDRLAEVTKAYDNGEASIGEVIAAQGDLLAAQKKLHKGWADQKDAIVKTDRSLDDLIDTTVEADHKFDTFGGALDNIVIDLTDAEKASMRTEAALKSMGITPQRELDELARKAAENFTIIQNSGTASAREIDAAWVIAMQARKDALENAGLELPREEAALLEKMLQHQRDFNTSSAGPSGIFTLWSQNVREITGTLGTDSLASLFSGEGLGGISGKLDGIKDAFFETFANQIGGIIDNFISTNLGRLMGGLDGVIGRIPGIGGALSGVFGGAGGGSGPSLPRIPGIPGLGGGGPVTPPFNPSLGMPDIPLPAGGLPVPANAGSFASGIPGLSGLMGSLSGLANPINAVSGAISAVTDVLGLFGVGRSGEMDRFNIIANNTSFLAWAFSIGGLHTAILDIKNWGDLQRDHWFPAFDEKLQDSRWSLEQIRDDANDIHMLDMPSLKTAVDFVAETVMMSVRELRDAFLSQQTVVKVFLDGEQITEGVSARQNFRARLAAG